MGHNASSMSAVKVLAKCTRNGDETGAKRIIMHPQSHEVIHEVDPDTNLTALMVACANNRTEIVSMILSRPNVRLSQIDKTGAGNTALHYAADGNSEECVRLLLKHHADAQYENQLGLWPLDIARLKGHVEAVQALQEPNVVFRGWLMVKQKGRLGIAYWKERYCILLESELVVYRKPGEAKPVCVLLLTAKVHVAQAVERSNASWTDAQHMFTLSQPILCHAMHTKSFSRREEIRKRLEYGESDPELVKFAAENESSRMAWIAAINNSTISPSELERISDHTLFPTPPTFTQFQTVQNVTIPSAPEVPNDCSVCMDAERNAVGIPCGHVSCCLACLTALKDSNAGCPICRTPLTDAMAIFIP